MKQFFSRGRILTLIAVLFIVPLLGAVSFSPPASAGSVKLQAILDNLTDDCKGMNKGSDTWKDCEKKQAELNLTANCTNKMFEEKGGKWSPKPAGLTDCQAKINDGAAIKAKLQPTIEKIKQCTKVKGDQYTICKYYQGIMAIIGCSDQMFEKVSGGGTFGGDEYSYKSSELSNCQKTLDAIVSDPATEPGEGAAATNDEAGANGSSTNCAGGAMGWLFCPLINYMSKTIQLAAGIIDSLLVVKFLSSQGGGQNIESIWRAILSVANILLVIAFMFIIFSQSTSLGLSNYGIKRMLPRLIIAAILMNLSFYICAIAIDFSNIIGGSIMGFLLGSGNTISSSMGAATGANGNLLGGVVAGIAIVGLLFFLLTPVLLAIVAILVILIGRQVVLLALVLVSPLAFVAWLLPNTEKYFKKWSELFFQMLILYPMVMLMFGAALLLSNILAQTGSDASSANLQGGG